MLLHGNNKQEDVEGISGTLNGSAMMPESELVSASSDADSSYLTA
jgi:hypothetical protein